MDGYGVLETLKREGVRSKVIVVSGDIQPEAHERVMALGALDFDQEAGLPGHPPCPAQAPRTVAIGHQVTAIQPQPVASHQAAQSSIQFTPELRDVYQELANVAMGQGADLLARLLGAFVLLPIPNVNVLEVSELHMALWPPPSRRRSLRSVKASSGPGSPGRPCCCSTMPASRTWPA